MSSRPGLTVWVAAKRIACWTLFGTPFTIGECVMTATPTTMPEPVSEPSSTLTYPSDKLDLIHRFLAACLTKAEIALAAETPADKRLLSHPLTIARMNYWRHVCSGIKWCGYLATCQQRHLLDDDPPNLKAMVEQWMMQPSD